MRRILYSVSIILALGSAPDSLQSQVPQAKDTAISGIDSTADQRRNFIEVGNSRFTPCLSLSKRVCAIVGALTLGTIGYVIGDIVAPDPTYAIAGGFYGGSNLGGQTCVENCGIPRKAIVFSLTGVALGGIAGWLGGKR